MSIIYGINPLLEQLMNDPGKLEVVYLLKGPLKGAQGRIARLAREAKVRVQFIDRKTMLRVSDSPNNQGVAGKVFEYEHANISEIYRSLTATSRIVVLDGIQDPQNLGAIVRSAVCFGAIAVIIPERNAAGMTPAAIKASAGAATRMKVVRVKNLVRTIKTLKEHNFWAVAIEGQGEIPVENIKADRRYAFVLGSEHKGIRKLVRESCDMSVRIPISAEFDSLNVSVAAGIVLHATAPPEIQFPA